MTQDKAQTAVNGHALNKGCNAGLSHLRASLRARREAVMPKAFASLTGQALCFCCVSCKGHAYSLRDAPYS